MKRGFSLTEMILYIAILGFMLLVIINILITINKSERALHSAKSIGGSALLSLERIVREARGADSILIASSTLGVNPSDLVLSGTDESGNLRVVEFSLQNGALHLKENGVDKGPLTQEDTSVTRLVFTRLTSPHSEALKTEMTLESGTSTYYQSGNFYSTAVLRGSL